MAGACSAGLRTGYSTTPEDPHLQPVRSEPGLRVRHLEGPARVQSQSRHSWENWAEAVSALRSAASAPTAREHEPVSLAAECSFPCRREASATPLRPVP